MDITVSIDKDGPFPYHVIKQEPNVDKDDQYPDSVIIKQEVDSDKDDLYPQEVNIKRETKIDSDDLFTYKVTIKQEPIVDKDDLQTNQVLTKKEGSVDKDYLYPYEVTVKKEPDIQHNSDLSKMRFEREKLPLYKCHSVLEKNEMIEADSKKKDMADQFPQSTLKSILKKKYDVDATLSTDSWKRRKPCEFPELEQYLFKWFTERRSRNVLVGGSLLREKAQFFAKKLGIRDFQASNKWLARFKRRNSIRFTKMCELTDVEIGNDWKQKLIEVISSYDQKDVFNAGETGLFYRCVPDRTLNFIMDKRYGRNSKEIITLLLCTNMDGSEKRKPFMIGKSAEPRCFANVKSFPMSYIANYNAWMTPQLFLEWLLDLNTEMMETKRKILLLLHNCGAHNNLPKLGNVRVEFLPTKTNLQPLDQIIKYFKIFYRKEIVARLMDSIDENLEHRVSILDAMNIAHKSWTNISQQSIQNSFAYFFNANTHAAPDITPEEFVAAEDWSRAVGDQKYPTFMDFVHLDDDLVTSSASYEILAQHDNSDSDDDDQPPKIISLKQARSHIAELSHFLSTKGVDDSVFSALACIENVIDRACVDQNVY